MVPHFLGTVPNRLTAIPDGRVSMVVEGNIINANDPLSTSQVNESNKSDAELFLGEAFLTCHVFYIFTTPATLSFPWSKLSLVIV